MNPVQYIFVNKTASRGQPMSTGKVASQAAHASVGGYSVSLNEMIDAWWEKGPTKIILEADNGIHINAIESVLTTAGVETFKVTDQAPTTENTANVVTALGVEILNKDATWVRTLFSQYKLYGAEKLVVVSPQKLTRTEFNELKVQFEKKHTNSVDQRQVQEKPLSPEQQLKALEEFNKSWINRIFRSRKKDFAGFPAALTGRPVAKKSTMFVTSAEADRLRIPGFSKLLDSRKADLYAEIDDRAAQRKT